MRSSHEPAESSQVRWVIMALSGVVFLGVAVVIYLLPSQGVPGQPSVLATLNACLNAAAAVCLTMGYLFIRRKNYAAHRRAMLAAFGISCMFLLTYLLHHARVGSVPFLGQGWIRAVYFSLLVPHILLAAGVVPMALLTIYRGWTDRLGAHRKIARVTLPIWLYVSLSGVALYWMLYHL
jgi:putative membrane protein